MENVILIGILVLILGGAGFYVYREKKRGAKCIGCPSGSNCAGNCSGCGANCHCNEDTPKEKNT